MRPRSHPERHGLPTAELLSRAVDTSDEARLGSLIEPQPNGCWLFTATIDAHGRAWIGKGIQVNVVRFVYTTLRGPIPLRAKLTQTCATDRCCNPDHYELTGVRPVDTRNPVAALNHIRSLQRSTTRRRGAP